MAVTEVQNLFTKTGTRSTSVSGNTAYKLRSSSSFYLRINYEIEETDDYVDCKFYVPYARTQTNLGLIKSGTGTAPTGTKEVSMSICNLRFLSGSTMDFSDSESTGVVFSIGLKAGMQITVPGVSFTQATTVNSELPLCDSQDEIIYTKRFYKTKQARTETITIRTADGVLASLGALTGTARFTHDGATDKVSSTVSGSNSTIADTVITVDVPAKAGATVRVKVDGAWEEGELKAKVNGEWVDADAAYVKVNGAWMEIN